MLERRVVTNQYEGQAASEWPDFQLRWDRSPARFHLAHDGLSPCQLDADDYVIRDVRIRDLDARLSHYNYRGPGELWSVGCARKTNRCIEHWLDGKEMTPPCVVGWEGRYLVLAGGNHRLAVAREKGAVEVPILQHIINVGDIDKILRCAPRSPAERGFPDDYPTALLP